MKRLGILGSTGSIGRNCLSVIEELPGQFRVVSLTAGENVNLMAEQVVAVRPDFVSMAHEKAANSLRKRLKEAGCHPLPEIAHGPEGMKQASTLAEVDLVISSTVGVFGLPATYAALLSGKQVALANKEVLVSAGKLITEAAKERNLELLPVDSEHNGVHQCLRAGRREEACRLVLTASGGPFLHTPLEQLPTMSVERALDHPTWKMGNRITIDSATMMNKGFEVIEACWLFGFSPQQVKVKIHPQSTVHSLVEFVDGSILAQLSATDMKIPIRYALSYPKRVASNNHAFDWGSLSVLQFSEPDTNRFPCLRLAYQAMEQGDSYPCALNAADEVAVAAFLERKIPFGAISRIVGDVLQNVASRQFSGIEDVLDHDQLARARAREMLSRYRN
ncbi:MAG: 1-deoxy-D-xylulose-5-phosphate reductoisomerase [Acidobacteria bacterium]|nr:1-deoxy-D-xylulose-5-phosphate reductoisomerase [Acidobacteriota bacterium]MCH8268133.1 1-deoxy-D-xylulose-5-phosphate reductoisomerase [Acidobacteriota bacterium]